MSADFLLELFSEEIPARMQARARNDLARMFAEKLAEAGLSHDGIVAYSTPRRLALIARGLPLTTEAMSEEVKGPRTSAPAQALEGFLRKTGLAQDQLQDRDGTWFAVINKPGRATSEVLAERIPLIVWDFPWPKSMRWGALSTSTESLKWVRPLHGIVAIHGDKIVEFTLNIGKLWPSRDGDIEVTRHLTGIASGAATRGHRFHHPGPITIGSAHDYVDKLRACHVIVDQNEREAIIRQGAIDAAEDAGFLLVEDEGLVVENAGLTSWPVPLLGSFDPAFLDVPEEVIQLTARINQKYFVMRDAGGKLAPHFVCVANIAANDGGEAIVAGNERVLAARLADARFFWEHDLKVPLDEQAEKLSGIIFHERLGTLADKVERVAKLARWLVEQRIVGTLSPTGRGQGEGAPTSSGKVELPHPNPLPTGEREQLADQAERAARLAKADLVTGMVGEFPELQGVIGGHLARAQGESDAVADAIRDHYKPVGQGDEVPTAPVTVALALADKIDTLASFFAIDEPPTGSKDPFALRRAVIGAISLWLTNGLRYSVQEVVKKGLEIAAAQKPIGDRLIALGTAAFHYGGKGSDPGGFAIEQEKLNLLLFFIDRLKVQQREAGVRHDLIDAVFALGGEEDLVRLLARVEALQHFVETPQGADLLAGYKRAANILKKEKRDLPRVMAGRGEQGIPQTGEEDPLAIAQAVAEMALGSAAPAEETALVAALNGAEPKATKAVRQEDFTAAMAALASLRAPIDAFFDKVTVNDPDATVRARRLNLLSRFRDAVHQVADFSKIEG